MIARFITLTFLLLISTNILSSSLLERSLGQIRSSGDNYQDLAYKIDEGSVNSQVREMAEKLNRRAPIMIDDHTRFDQATSDEKQITYYFTLVSQKNSPELKLMMDQHLKTKLRNEYCFAPQMRYLKTNNISLKYSYFDYEGIQIISRVASGKTCDES